MKQIKKVFYNILKLFSWTISNKYLYVQYQMNDRGKSIFKRSNRAKFDSWDSVRRDMFALIVNDIKDVKGDFVECGVYKGHTAKLIHHIAPERRLYLMDTFDGFRKEDDNNMEGVFGDTSVEGVFKYIAPENSNVSIIEGRIPDSIPNDFKNKKFALIHLDMDIYLPTKAAIEFFYPRLSRGGYMILHDYNNIRWPGIKKAVDEYFKRTPIQMPDNGGSAIIQKI